MKKTQIFFKNHWRKMALLLLFAAHLFLRFYQLESKSPFGWDQVDNAWAAKDILVDHHWPLLGMQAKQNSGFFIGPFYYYFVAIFYFLTKLDPIASGIIAGITSIFTFWVFYLLIKRLFSEKIALIALFLHTFSFYIISLDRNQWPVNLIAPISLIIFWLLLNVINGGEKYLPWLAFVVGFSFHLNFTSVFFPLIIIFTLPFFPKTRGSVKYYLFSIPLFMVWLLPNILAELQSQNSGSHNLTVYLQTYYHGFHLTRFFQVAKDALIEFEGILIGKIDFLKVFKPIKFLLLPLFLVIYLFSIPSKKRFIFGYLMLLWILIPWLVFSVYSGEISSYYFSLTRPIVIMTVAYLLWRIMSLNIRVIALLLFLFIPIYAIINTQDFLRINNKGLDDYRRKVKGAISKNEAIEFRQGVPESYLYYFYTKLQTK